MARRKIKVIARDERRKRSLKTGSWHALDVRERAGS